MHRLPLTLLAVALFVAPLSAQASGSWAVPRFTPTWAELQRDLKALGFKTAAVKKRPVTPRKKVEVAKVAGEGTGLNSDGTVKSGTVADAAKVGTDTRTTTEGTTGTAKVEGDKATPTDIAGTASQCAAGFLCVPLRGQIELPLSPLLLVPASTTPSSSVAPDPNPNPEVVNPVKEVPQNTVGNTGKGKKLPSKQGKTGRPKADDEKDTDKLKKKKYWWQDQQ